MEFSLNRAACSMASNSMILVLYKSLTSSNSEIRVFSNVTSSPLAPLLDDLLSLSSPELPSSPLSSFCLLDLFGFPAEESPFSFELSFRRLLIPGKELPSWRPSELKLLGK